MGTLRVALPILVTAIVAVAPLAAADQTFFLGPNGGLELAATGTFEDPVGQYVGSVFTGQGATVYHHKLVAGGDLQIKETRIWLEVKQPTPSSPVTSSGVYCPLEVDISAGDSAWYNCFGDTSALAIPGTYEFDLSWGDQAVLHTKPGDDLQLTVWNEGAATGPASLYTVDGGTQQPSVLVLGGAAEPGLDNTTSSSTDTSTSDSGTPTSSTSASSATTTSAATTSTRPASRSSSASTSSAASLAPSSSQVATGSATASAKASPALPFVLVAVALLLAARRRLPKA